MKKWKYAFLHEKNVVCIITQKSINNKNSNVVVNLKWGVLYWVYLSRQRPKPRSPQRGFFLFLRVRNFQYFSISPTPTERKKRPVKNTPQHTSKKPPDKIAFLKMSAKCRLNLIKQNRNTLIYNTLRFFVVLGAGLEPAQALLPTGF